MIGTPDICAAFIKLLWLSTQSLLPGIPLRSVRAAPRRVVDVDVSGVVSVPAAAGVAGPCPASVV